MSDFLNRTTLEFQRSRNDTDSPDPPWLLVEPGSPNRTLIDTVPRRYLTLTGDVLSEKSQAEKDAVDAAILDAEREDTASRLDELEDISRAFALVVLDELNARADTWNAILDAADGANNLAAFKAAMAAIPDYPQRTIAQMRSGVRAKLGT